MGGVALTGLELEAVNSTLTGSALGSIGGVPVSAALALKRPIVNGAPGNASVRMTMLATNVTNVTAITAALLPNGSVPAAVQDAASAWSFQWMTIDYASTRRGRSPFGMTAMPDLASQPGIANVLTTIGMSSRDLRYILSPAGTTFFGAVKNVSLDLGAPFAGPVVLSFTVAVAPFVGLQDKEVMLKASATGALAVDDFQQVGCAEGCI